MWITPFNNTLTLRYFAISVSTVVQIVTDVFCTSCVQHCSASVININPQRVSQASYGMICITHSDLPMPSISFF